MLDIADVQNINSTTIKIDEILEKKDLKNFIYNSLEEKNIPFNNHDKILVNYMYLTNEYQVFIIEDRFIKLIFEVLSSYYDSSDAVDNTLFITENFIAVYIDKEFYFYQEINYSLDEDDLKKYILKKLNVVIHTVCKIDNLQLESMTKDFIKNQNKSFHLVNINDKSSNYLFIYSIYLTVLLVCSFSYVFYEKNEIEQSVLNEKNSLITKNNLNAMNHKFYSLFKDYNDFILLLNNHNIEVLHLEYKTKKITFSIKSDKKENLYDFLDAYKTKVLSNVINLVDDKKFVLDGTISIKS